MSSMTMGQKPFQQTPPMKGSFPLDHDGECKPFMVKYMACLHQSGMNNSACREQSKDYLDCRMQKGLMAQEDWTRLGYADVVAKQAARADTAADSSTASADAVTSASATAADVRSAAVTSVATTAAAVTSAAATTSTPGSTGGA